jgi:CBS domain-containing protein
VRGDWREPSSGAPAVPGLRQRKHAAARPAEDHANLPTRSDAMTVKDLCRPRAVTVDRSATLAEAAQLMRSHHVGALLVTTEASGHALVSGIVTDRDLALEGLTRAPGEPSLRVGDIARPHLVAVRGDAHLAQAVQLMQEHGVRRLLVVEAEGRVSGVLSIDDVVHAMAAQLGAVAAAMRGGAAHEAAQLGALPRLPVHEDRSTAPPPAHRGVAFLPMGTPGMH